MADSSNDGKLMLLQNLLEVKAAELDLLARRLRGVLLQNQVSPMMEDEFRGTVSEIMHEIGMLESAEASVWNHYQSQLAPEFEPRSAGVFSIYKSNIT
jgi:hypothetical protein